MHLFSRLNTKQTNNGIFRKRQGKIFIWEKFSGPGESDFKSAFFHKFMDLSLLIN